MKEVVYFIIVIGLIALVFTDYKTNKNQKMKAVKNGKPEIKIKTKDGKEIEVPKSRKFVLSFEDDGKGLKSNIDTNGFTPMEQIAMVEIIKNNLLRDHFTPRKIK